MRILSVNLVLSLFRFTVSLLKRIEARDTKASVGINRQIDELRVQQTILDESALKASRVASKIKEIIS